jgi:CHAD domain-containing protein
MPYELEPQEPFGPGLRRILSEQLDDAAKELSGASDDWEEAVHEARKGVKKCRAVLRLARPSIGPLYGEANTALRDIGRSLSDVRDDRVLVGTVDQLAEAFPEQAAGQAFERVRRSLEERANRSMEQAVAERLHERTAERLRRVGAPAAKGPWEEPGWKFVEGGLRREYARGRDAFDSARDKPGGAAVHAWRKRVKDHWYHLRLLRAAWSPVLRKTAKVAHDLSDLLGDEHDLVVLQQTLRAANGWAPDDARLLSSLADRRRAEVFVAAEPMGRHLYAEKPARFTARIRAYWKIARAEAEGRVDLEPHSAAG